MATAGDIQSGQIRIQTIRSDDEIAAGNMTQAPIAHCRSKSRRSFFLFYFLVVLIVAYPLHFGSNVDVVCQ